MRLYLPLIIVLTIGITSCSCGSSQEHSSEEDPRIPTPVWRAPVSPEPTPTEEPTVTPDPSPTATPDLQSCSEGKMWLCHIPHSVLDQNDNNCQSESCNESQAKWLCLPPPAIESHLEHHEHDYVRGMIVEPAFCEED